MVNHGENNDPAAPPLLGQVQMPAAAAEPIDAQVYRNTTDQDLGAPSFSSFLA